MGQPKKVILKDGSVRYQIVTEAGRDPVTGKRKQVMRRFERSKDAKSTSLSFRPRCSHHDLGVRSFVREALKRRVLRVFIS